MPPLHQILTRRKLWRRAQGFSRPREDQRESQKWNSAGAHPLPLDPGPLPPPALTWLGPHGEAGGGVRTGTAELPGQLGRGRGHQGRGLRGEYGRGGSGGGWWRLEPRPARRQMERGARTEGRESKEEAPSGLGRAGTQGRAARPGRRPGLPAA